ncbi:MAG TPA: glycosyltransferase family 39 protein [Bryobacteraceae bacterium]|nr:glycosyltransferase family 39 protein [Bryobacteraceae bacterium]
MPHLGIQNDEALFAAGLWDPAGLLYHRRAFGHDVPIMLMSYLGALKCWVYAAIFRVWEPTQWSIRIPVVAAGGLTVWLFFLLLRRIASERTAVAGCVLLAADTSYLLTTTFDWGPVALQHLMLVGGVLLLVVFAQNRWWQALAGAAFLFGAGAWDKALFFWLLGGLAVALLVIYPREILRLFTPWRCAVAVLGFCLGALPLLLFNLNAHHRFETFRSNASYSTSDLRGKANLVRYSLEGSALFGWLVAEDYEAPSPQPPGTVVARASAWLSTAAGQPRRNLLSYGFLIALALTAWLWWRQGWKGEVRMLAATLVFLGVAWIQMALTQNAGGAIHHVVLLWPAPHLVIALAFGTASRHFRGGAIALAGVTAILAGSSLLVTNQHYAQMVRNGGGLNWTEAVYPLARYANNLPARRVYVTDWGILDTLRLLSRGTLPLAVGSDPVSKPALNDADREVVRTWVSDPGHIFIGHTEGNEFFTGSRKNLLDTAAGLGFRPEFLHVVPDRHGRRIFEVFRFVR